MKQFCYTCIYIFSSIRVCCSLSRYSLSRNWNGQNNSGRCIRRLMLRLFKENKVRFKSKIICTCVNELAALKKNTILKLLNSQHKTEFSACYFLILSEHLFSKNYNGVMAETGTLHDHVRKTSKFI